MKFKKSRLTIVICDRISLLKFYIKSVKDCQTHSPFLT